MVGALLVCAVLPRTVNRSRQMWPHRCHTDDRAHVPATLTRSTRRRRGVTTAHNDTSSFNPRRPDDTATAERNGGGPSSNSVFGVSVGALRRHRTNPATATNVATEARSQLPIPTPAIAPVSPTAARSGKPQHKPTAAATAPNGAKGDDLEGLMRPIVELLLQEKVKGVTFDHADRTDC